VQPGYSTVGTGIELLKVISASLPYQYFAIQTSESFHKQTFQVCVSLLNIHIVAMFLCSAIIPGPIGECW